MSLKNIDKALFEKLTILYVEDDAHTREEVSFFLKRIVGNLYTAENGKEGFELFQKHKFDMVITDIQMPIMNGLDMVKAIRKLDTKIPVAVTTAFSDTDFLIKAIECGVDKYILKPIDMMEMTAVIQKCTSYGYMEQKIEEFDNYSQFILSQNASFMFTVSNGDLDYANTHLMDMFGIQSFEELYDKSLYFSEDHKLYQKENWIQYVKDNENRQYTVALGKLDKRYNLIYRHFDEIAKSVFIFKESEENIQLELV
ncbi:MAG TPA: response regulator [Campylobacterales bacterium]|nr:response regulator [Campylobacterales bacterium]